MLTKENGFELPLKWTFPDANKYAFAFISLFIILLIIYSNSFQGTFQFDDTINIVQNKNIFLESFDWPHIKSTFYGVEGKKIDRPLAFLSFAFNYHIHKLDVFGYHVVNFAIHYLAAVFLFLFLFRTLNLPKLRQQYGHISYSVALLSAILWATSPVQVTAVTYIVQRMASMAGLFYIMSMFFYLKGRTADQPWRSIFYWGFCIVSALLSFGSKENAVLLPISIWLYDLLLIQGVTRENLIKNLKIFVPLALIFAAIGFWYVNIEHILSGDAYSNRPFTLAERLLTEPRVVIFYISLLLYPISSRLTLIHDIPLSTSLLSPWSTLPAIALIVSLIAVAVYFSKRKPFIAFCILFFFLNHLIESTFIPLELIYEHRNYIPSMFFFAPIAIFILYSIDYFSYKKTIQFIIVAVITFLIVAQGHTVFIRNGLFAHPVLLWTDNVLKTPTLSRTYNNLGAEYWKLGYFEKAYEQYLKARSLDRQTNYTNRGVNLYNFGMYNLNITKQYDKALGFYQKAIKIYPGFWPSYHDAAVCYIRKGDLAEAGRRLVEALSLWPDNAQMRHTLGFVLLKSGKYDDAIKQARQALSFNPELFNSFSILGEAYRKKGNFNMAIFNWNKYLERNPNDLEGNLALIELYYKTNNYDQLCRTIGRLTLLKGAAGLDTLIDQLLKDKILLVYVPDYKEIISILHNHSCN